LGLAAKLDPKHFQQMSIVLGPAVALEGAFLYCVFSQELRLGVLPSLPKVVRSCLAAGPIVVGPGCKARPKTLPTSVNSIGFWCPTGPKIKNLFLTSH